MSVSYFEQPGLWQNTPDPYQIQTQADVLDFLPDDVERVLDVGCGDGFITNRLPDHLFVIGSDSSYQALQGVGRPVSLGEITALPFPDESFDLVMANDVLEHIPDVDLSRALAELRRVTRAYILVTVPFEEDLNARQAKCAQCGATYHVNHHHRSYSKSDMLSLFEGLAKPLEIRLSGYLNRPPLDPTTHIRHQFNLFQRWPYTRCPVCGSGELVSSTVGKPVESWLDRKRAELWAQQLQNGEFWSNRTEIMALYACAGNHIERHVPEPEIEEQSLLGIDFRNPLQIANPDFTAGYLGAQFQLASNVTLVESGVIAGNDPSGIPMVAVRLPVIPQIQDSIQIQALAPVAGTIRLFALGNGRERYLATLHFDPETNRATYTFDRYWRTERLGLVMQLYLDASVVLQSIRYIPMGGEKVVSAPFVKVHPGHNVVLLEKESYLLTWGFLAEREGSAPLVLEDRFGPDNHGQQISAEEALVEAIEELYRQERVALQADETVGQLEHVSMSLDSALRQLKLAAADLTDSQSILSSGRNTLQDSNQDWAE